MALPAMKVMRLADVLPLEPVTSLSSARTSTRAGSIANTSAAIWRKERVRPLPHLGAHTADDRVLDLIACPCNSTQA
jgi:hypothetical protein